MVDGVVRWKSNGEVPPQEVLDANRDRIPPVVMEKSIKVREQETEAFLREYRKQNLNRKPSHEELMEMRAAFGPGTTVVDVITGRKTKL
jgi:hypothetical protein